MGVRPGQKKEKISVKPSRQPKDCCLVSECILSITHVSVRAHSAWKISPLLGSTPTQSTSENLIRRKEKRKAEMRLFILFILPDIN